MPESANQAVFLSYASQDEAVARQLCEALRAAGIEVWFDQSELRGGDAWDANIRRQIRDCALFVPLISAGTQQRREGYFRLEWSLADERSRLIAEGTPFILPVVVDATKERDALVPKAFLNVQWTWLPHGGVPPAFVVRVQRLLGVSEPGVASAAAVPMLTLPSHEGRAHTSLAFSRLLPWALAILSTGLLAWIALRPPSPRSQSDAAPASSRPVYHTIIQLPPDAPLAPPRAHPLGATYPSLALSPDDTLLVYVALAGQTTQLYLRPLNQPEARPIPGTEGGYCPFFSPDGRWIGFFAKDKLKKISVLGGAAVELCDSGSETHGACWGDDDMIYFGSFLRFSRVSSTGGTVEILKDNEGDLRVFSPTILAGARMIVGSFRSTVGEVNSGDFRKIEAHSLSSRQQTSVVDRGHSPRFMPPGYLVFARGNGLLAAPFDAAHARATGETVPVVEGVLSSASSYVAQFAISASGSLVYAAGGALDTTTPAWVDQNGNHRKLAMKAQTYGQVRLSPDGRKLAAVVPGMNVKLWSFDVETGNGTSLAEPGTNINPVWAHDGSRFFFASERGLKSGIYELAADGSEQPAKLLHEFRTPGLLAMPQACFPGSNRLLVFTFSEGKLEAFALSLDGTNKLEPFPSLDGALFARFSSDGRLISYASGKSGRLEVYVEVDPSDWTVGT